VFAAAAILDLLPLRREIGTNLRIKRSSRGSKRRLKRRRGCGALSAASRQRTMLRTRRRTSAAASRESRSRWRCSLRPVPRSSSASSRRNGERASTGSRSPFPSALKAGEAVTEAVVAMVRNRLVAHWRRERAAREQVRASLPASWRNDSRPKMDEAREIHVEAMVRHFDGAPRMNR
jgi:hypothetical protein